VPRQPGHGGTDAHEGPLAALCSVGDPTFDLGARLVPADAPSLELAGGKGRIPASLRRHLATWPSGTAFSSV